MLPFLTLPLLLARTVLAFGGEDPVLGRPWYHELLTRLGAKAAGWDVGTDTLPPKGQVDEDDDGKSAASSLAWHCDYVDSYLYNFVWNAGGGIDRFKAALLAHDDLIKVHFDDLSSTPQIQLMWNRYLAGTVAGLLLAADTGDVPAARHVVGVGLHAAQDFYSHSNWVDDPARRLTTWFEMPADDRAQLALYSGVYELPEHLGFKHHSKLSIDCILMRQINDVVGADTMDLLCTGISPLSDISICRRWRECKQNSVPVHPDTIGGVPVPKNVVFLGPPGIALDSTWLSRVNAANRDTPETTNGPLPPPVQDKLGVALFTKATELAQRHTAQWLRQLGEIMAAAGHGVFWTEVTQRGRQGDKVPPGLPILEKYLSSFAEDVHQYEQPDKLPLRFLSAGNYPPDPTGGEEGWFVRLVLHTADDEFGTGTNADIDVEIGGKTFRLDHGRKVSFLAEFNDFEDGDHTAYVVGPFAERPAQMRLINNGATIFDIIEAAWEDIKDAAESVFDAILDFLLTIVGGHPEYIGTRKVDWTWEELDAIATSGIGERFHVFVDGGDEGKHEVHGILGCERQPNGSLKAFVRLTKLVTIEEADEDEPSDDPFDDEVVVMMLVNSQAAGQLRRFRTSPIDNVDDDETHAISMESIVVDVPRHGGLIVPIQLWESDLEGDGARDDLLRAFAGQHSDATEEPTSAFLEALGAAVLPDWKLASVDAFAFRRGPVVQTAHLAKNKRVDRWVDAGNSVVVQFDRAPTRRTPVPALFPATTSVPMTSAGAIGGVTVGPLGVFAVSAPQPPGTADPGRLQRFGLHLEPGPSAPSEPPARSVAFDPALGRVYSVTVNDTLRMYDAESMALLGTAPVGFGAWDVAVDATARRVYVSRWRVVGGGTVLVFDADTLALLHQVVRDDQFFGPLGLAVDPELNRVIVARDFHSGGPGDPTVTAMTAFTRRPDDTLDHLVTVEFSPVQLQPTDVAVDAQAGMVFLACLGANVAGAQPRLSIHDRATLFVKGSVQLPGPARAVAARPGSGIAHVVGEAGLTYVDGRARAVLFTVPLGPQPGAVAVDPDTGVAYVGDLKNGTVTRVDAPLGLT